MTSAILTREILIILATAWLVGLGNSLLGIHLNLRKKALLGDSISHSLLPGIVIAFLITQSFAGASMLLGALIGGLFCVFLIEFIQKSRLIASDLSMGIVFTTLFSLGVILIHRYAHNVDLDIDCILFGELLFVPFQNNITLFGYLVPQSLIPLTSITLAVLAICFVLHRNFSLISFNESYAKIVGVPVKKLNVVFTLLVSINVVYALDSVGAILVVGFLIIPGAIARLFFKRFRNIFIAAQVFQILASTLGIWIAFKLNLNLGGSIVSTLFLFYLIAFFIKSAHIYLKQRRDSISHASSINRPQF